MKKTTNKIPNPNYLLAKSMHLKNNKPGQNQSVTTKRCILNINRLLGTVNPLTFSKVI